MQIVEKHKLATRWFHWINFPVLGLMIWSGLMIYWANDVYGVWWGGKEVFHFFPHAAPDAKEPSFFDARLGYSLASGMAWHFTVMWLFMVNGLLYVLWALFSGHWRELAPGRGALKESLLVVLHDLHLTKKPLPERKFNAAQQFAYTGVIAMGVGSTLTGLAIYKPVNLGWLAALLGGYEFSRAIHFILTLAYVAFFIVHVAQVARAGWNNFRAMLTGHELVPTPAAHEETA